MPTICEEGETQGVPPPFPDSFQQHPLPFQGSKHVITCVILRHNGRAITDKKKQGAPWTLAEVDFGRWWPIFSRTSSLKERCSAHDKGVVLAECLE